MRLFSVQYVEALCQEITLLKKENEELKREKTKRLDLAIKGEAVRHRVMLDLVLGRVQT